MKQTAIPFVFMRGGTSRGPYFRKSDLPVDQETLANVLIHALGSGHPLNIDGLGGGNAVTTKVAILSKSDDSWADIDYYFAQVAVEKKLVDFKPSCGNILSGVAPAAIEMGLIEPADDISHIKIRAVNTEARIIATIETPDGVSYEGDTVINGVPGTGSPIQLQFMDTVGGVTGAFMPTGKPVDTIDGIDVTCMDVAMPMVIARATSFGLTGYESVTELDANKAFYERMEAIRIKAGREMGLGDVSQSVIPKFGLLAPAVQGGTISTRYFMPWNCHPSMAVTGAQCLAACVLTPNSVADGLSMASDASPTTVTLENPSGSLGVVVEHSKDEHGFILVSAGLVRTARKLAEGRVFVPASVWAGT